MSFTIPPTPPVVNSLSYEAVILDRRTVSAISPDHIGDAIKQLAYDMDVALRSGSASARAVALDLLQYERDNQSRVDNLDKGMDEKMALKAKTSRGIADKPAKPSPTSPTHTPACVECGATFAHVPGRKYCSERCSREFWRKREAERSVVGAWRKEKPCSICQCLFMPPHPCSKTCSDTCRMAQIAANQRREYNARNARRVAARAQKKSEVAA